MTRVHQALERARAMDRQKEDVGPVGRPAEDRPALIRHSTVTDTRTAITEPLALGRIAPTRCPGCGKRREGPLRGPWLGRLLGLMGIPLYRCRFCHHRFSGVEGHPEMNQLEGSSFSAFLRPADNRLFDEVIRDLARDEQEQGEHGQSSNAPHGNEGVKEFRKPENWSVAGAVRRSPPRT